MEALKQKTTMGLKGWAIVLSLTLLLVCEACPEALSEVPVPNMEVRELD